MVISSNSTKLLNAVAPPTAIDQLKQSDGELKAEARGGCNTSSGSIMVQAKEITSFFKAGAIGSEDTMMDFEQSPTAAFCQ